MAKNTSRNNNRGKDRGFKTENFESNFQGFSSLNDRSRSERQSFKAVCSECGADCDLPFKPAQGRPVFCRDCFQKHKK